MFTEMKISEQEMALADLRSFISSGNFASGDRLPPERELTTSLGMTRTRLRRALDELERDGVIWRGVGKGTFMASGESSSVSSLSRRVTPVQMMRARYALEPAIAHEAAINASSEAVVRIGLCRDRAAAAGNWNEYETCDDMFHAAVADATCNILLVSLFEQLNKVRRAVAWGSVVRESSKPPADHPSYAEHDRLVDAISARDPGSARKAMKEHLTSVSTRLFGDI